MNLFKWGTDTQTADISKANNYIDQALEGKRDLRSQYSNYTAVQRVSQDILKWREAIKQAENQWNPDRTKLIELYNDVILDGHVYACLQKRSNLTLKKEFCFVDKDGKEIENLEDIFEQRWFYDLQNFVIDALYFGYSVINWTGVKNEKLTGLKIIRRDMINIDRRIIVSYKGQTTGKSLDDNDIIDWNLTVTTTDRLGYTTCDYGILYKVALYQIFSRNNLGYNAEFVEKFIMPFVVARTSKTEEEERRELEEGIANMASSNSVLLDPMDEIEFIESKNAGSGYNSFDNLENRCEKKISKIILGHADAIDSVTGKLGATGEKDAVSESIDDIEVHDNNFVEYIINDLFLDKLKKLGFSIPEGVKFKYKNNNEKYEELKKENEVNSTFATTVKTLFDAGIQVDEKQITEKTGLIVTKIETPVAPKTQKAITNLYSGI